MLATLDFRVDGAIALFSSRIPVLTGRGESAGRLRRQIARPAVDTEGPTLTDGVWEFQTPACMEKPSALARKAFSGSGSGVPGRLRSVRAFRPVRGPKAIR